MASIEPDTSVATFLRAIAPVFLLVGALHLVLEGTGKVM